MKKIDLDKATGTLAEYARKAKDLPIVFTRRGKPVAALVSMQNRDFESLALSTSPRFRTVIERSRARQKAEGDVSLEEARRLFKAKR